MNRRLECFFTLLGTKELQKLQRDLVKGKLSENKAEQKLGRILIARHLAGESATLDKKALAKLLFKGDERNRLDRLDDSGYRLAKHVEKFILSLRLEDNKIVRSFELIEFLKQRGASQGVIEKEYKALRKEIDKMKIDRFSSLLNFRYYNSIYSFLGRQQNLDNLKNLGLSQSYLNDFHLSMSTELLVEKEFVKIGLGEKLLKSEVSISSFQAEWYLALRKAFAIETVEVADKIKDLIKLLFNSKTKLKLHPTFGHSCYIELINLCQVKHQIQEVDLKGQMFKIYQKAYQFNYLFIGNQVPFIGMQNLIHVSSTVNKLGWVYKILPKVLSRMAIGDQRGIKAILAYVSHEYEECLRHCRQLQLTNSFHNLVIRSVELRSAYMLNSYEQVHSISRAFEMYLRRTRGIPRELKSSNMKFVLLVRRLSSQPKDKQIRIIQKTLSKDPKIAYALWLNALVTNNG